MQSGFIRYARSSSSWQVYLHTYPQVHVHGQLYTGDRDHVHVSAHLEIHPLNQVRLEGLRRVRAYGHLDMVPP